MPLAGARNMHCETSSVVNMLQPSRIGFILITITLTFHSIVHCLLPSHLFQWWPKKNLTLIINMSRLNDLKDFKSHVYKLWGSNLGRQIQMCKYSLIIQRTCHPTHPSCLPSWGSRATSMLERQEWKKWRSYQKAHLLHWRSLHTWDPWVFFSLNVLVI